MMKQKMDYLTFIIAGIRNKPGRNLATVFCFAFIAANIFSAQFLFAGTVMNVDQGISRMGADHLVVASQYTAHLRGSENAPENTIAIVKVEPSLFRFKANIMEKIGKVPGVSNLSPQLYVATLDLPSLSPAPVDIFGIDPATDFTIQPWLRTPMKNPPGPGEVIVGSEISGEVSTLITVPGHTYTIVGRLDPTQSTVDHTVFLRLDDAYTLAAAEGIIPPSAPRISPGDVNAVLVQVKHGADTDMVKSRIQQPFSYSYVKVIQRHFALDPVSQEVQGLSSLLNMISAVVVIAAVPLIALIAAMVAHERQREIGLLKSMGAKRNVIFFLVIAESLVLAVIGGTVGVGASLVGFFLLNTKGFFNSAFQVSLRMPANAEIGFMAVMALSVVIAIGSIASLYPAYRCSMMNPYDAIRSEEQ
jgi:putative ABC transport system permease protein